MMQIFHSIDEYSRAAQTDSRLSRPAAVTPGKFDGVHRGHQKLLRKITEQKQTRGCSALVFAIDVNPSGILSAQEREEYLCRMGIDVLVECPLSDTLMHMSPDIFIRQVLKETFHTAYIAVGTDYRFGFRRAGTPQLLLDMQQRYDFAAEVIGKELYLGEEISSTRVREALLEGRMKLVRELLGRPYPVSGTVLHGKKIGRTIGFPTLNQIPPESKLLPPDGVYASFVTDEHGTRMRGVTNIGTNPTVGGTQRSVETYLLDAAGDFYDRRIRTDLICRQRGEMKFDSLSALQSQMEKDKEQAKLLLDADED